MYNIRGYPTLILFAEGEQIQYKGKKSAQDLHDWIIKHFLHKSKEIKSCKDLRSLLKNRDRKTLLYVGDTKKYETSDLLQSFFQMSQN